MPEESLVNAKNGFTVLVAETALHSRYDPVSEAEKYIDSLRLTPYNCFILLEPGLDYLSAVIKKKYPRARIISLHCSSFFDRENFLLKNNAGNFSEECSSSWNPASGKTLEDFLELTLQDADAADIKLIDWKPSVSIYGKSCLDLASRTVECIRRISAGRKTAANFGRRWIKNALHNLEFLQNTVTALPGSRQILVCAAGPGLEDSMDEIAGFNKNAGRPFIISVSSAGPALVHKGIMPDIIITSDGGSWARYHLTECLRQCQKLFYKTPVFASALTAILPSQIQNYPVLVIRDGSLWQDLLLKTAGVFSLAFPQRGTVSITALDLAFYLSPENVYISGFDFAHRDIVTHARPYAFEYILEQKQNRKEPFYSLVYKREEMIRTSGSHGIYASWFTSHLSSFPDRLYSLGKSGYGVPQGKPFLDKKGKDARLTTENKKNTAGKKSLIDVIVKAIDNPGTGKQIGKELKELLLPEMPVEDHNFTNELKRTLWELADG